MMAKKKDSTEPPASPDAGQAAKRMTLKTLAEHLELSPATVSLVLNNSPVADSIPQRTKDRVLEAAREHNYRPDFAARTLRQGRSLSIGVMVSEISGGYSAGVMSGIERTLLPAGYFGLVASHEFDHDYFRRYLDLFQDRSVDGYILVNTPVEETPALPTVVISGARELAGVSNVVIDHDHAAQLALQHLKALGHQRIACFRGPSIIPDSEDRWRAIQKAATDVGIALREDLMIQLGVEPLDRAFSLEEFYRSGYEIGQELARRHAEFTALFAFNDPSAIGAMRAFQEAGIRVPEDISVVGFDDIESAAFHNPGLTTIKQPLHEMGEIGARLLLKLLAGEVIEPGQIRVEPELVVRESTAGSAHTRS